MEKRVNSVVGILSSSSVQSSSSSEKKSGVFDCYGPAVLHTEKGRLDLGVHYFPGFVQVLRE